MSLGLVDGRARWVWREWFRLERVGDGRGKEGRSRVLEGAGKMEGVFGGAYD